MITYTHVGIVKSPFKEPKGSPIQTTAAYGVEGVIEIFPEYRAGLKDIEGFSHLILLYHFHLVQQTELLVQPFLDNERHGIFATRAPARPNKIGFSVVRLTGVSDNLLYIQDVDVLDGTPVLDIKPYVPAFDVKQAERTGWFETKLHYLPTIRDDGRFSIKRRRGTDEEKAFELGAPLVRSDE